MIGRLKGKLIKKSDTTVYIDTGGVCFEVNIPKTVSYRLNNNVGEEIELVIYHYLQMDKNRALPVMIGFLDELERDFFESFISVSGIGPRVALKSFDQPIPLIAKAIEDGNIDFLKSLGGIGKQKAKQIVAQLQGKVGRFALIKEETKTISIDRKVIIEEAKHILKRLQYSTKEIDSMINKALDVMLEINSVEELLNEIYRQGK
ncbi:MAG: helix-hairpin-helix domain-containing protein [Candidatus Omnitrophica bacterium]|nr:helix-hairpin-helix domain-containing protein [Candidatus Omnitrophota bacterium]